MFKKGNNKGFVSLLTTQFLGAFNDNAFKLVIAFIAVDQFAEKSGGTLYLALSGAIFIFPFLLFSTYAGFLADRFSKKVIIIWAKVAELLVMGLGLWALMHGNIWPLLCILFFMGMQSAFFSPSKYGILPEILNEEKLSEGNGLIQMWTYAAIILGQAAGGCLIHITKPDIFNASYVFIAISVIGIISSLFVTKVEASGSQRKFEWNFLKEIYGNIKRIKKKQAIFLSIMGLMYFGFIGGLFQLNILLYARKVMGVNHLMSSVLLVVLTLGLGLGSFLAGKFSDQKIELGLVPMGAIGLSLFSILLGFVYHSYAQVSICLFLLGISSGFYFIPLNALIQLESPVDRRGQVLATNNFLSFIAILLGSGSVYLLRDLVSINAAQIFIISGILTILGTIYICRLLPYALVRLIVWLLTHTIYKIRTVDNKHVPHQGGALVVSNHVAMIDALLIVVSIQRPVRFLVNRNVYNLKLLNPILRLARSIPIASDDNPKEIIRSLNEAKDAVKNGEIVCLFAEGQLTRTGNMLKFNKGLEHIMKDVDCPIIPVHLDRVWGSIFSYERGKYYCKIPKIIPYPVTVSFGEPLPAQSTAYEVRNRVLELGAEAFQYRMVSRATLSEVFWQGARRHPSKFCVADSSGRKLSYGATLVSSVALADKLKEALSAERIVGIMLPPSVPGSLINIAVSILNKIPVNLNYTSSKESLNSVCEQCSMKYVITSRKFIEKTQIDVPGELIFVEDIIATMSKTNKLIAAFKAFAFPRFLSYVLIFGRKTNRDIEDLATIMFTSGSTGEPKGVMLTHANISSNLEGLYQVFHVQNDDVVMGVLPFFHSFGFTATLWFPLLSGIGAVYHVNPLDAKVVGNLVHKYKATILKSTPTFLNAYTRRCDAAQFKSLRIVVLGAEKLKESVANAFKDKFGITPMEGYGCTELSPVVSLSLPDYFGKFGHQIAHKPGKIGVPLPGIAIKILDQNSQEPVGVNEDGLLFIKGPNVMKGYLNQEEKTKEVIQDGWYATGDIANIDEDGFLTITDRISRFSKIGGEMVPHIKIEEEIHSILNTSEQVCVVASVPDEKKGERIVVLYIGEINLDDLVGRLQESDLPKLWIPSVDSFHRIDAIPLLGSGKLDLGAIKRRAIEIYRKDGQE